MSKATNQSLLSLSLTAGIFSEIKRRNLVCRVDLKEVVQAAYNQTIHLINTWDETGDPKKNTVWMTEALNRWDREAFGNQKLQRVESLIAMADLIVTDLLAKLKNKKKLAAVNSLYDQIQVLMNFTDYNRERFLAFEESDALLKILYRISEM
jgi:hypothetical protein